MRIHSKDELNKISGYYDSFPYNNPKNAYVWGAIHGMLIQSIVLTVVMLVMFSP